MLFLNKRVVNRGSPQYRIKLHTLLKYPLHTKSSGLEKEARTKWSSDNRNGLVLYEEEKH